MIINPNYDISDKINRHMLPNTCRAQFYDIVNRKLHELAYQMDGIKPDEDRIDKYGARLVQPNGNWTFTWKGVKVLRVDFYSDRVDIYPCNANGSPKVPEGCDVDPKPNTRKREEREQDSN